jgi:hypothetical protein
MPNDASSISAALMVLLVIGGTIAAVVLLLLPIWIARSRQIENQSGVLILTVLSLLLPVLWIVAIVVACVSRVRAGPAYSPSPRYRTSRQREVSALRALADGYPGPRNQQWTIFGVDSQTQIESDWSIDAPTRDDAIAEAQRRGIVIHSIQATS